MLPCLIFEDDHLLVISKPAGINTHAPSPYSGEGIYDWLRHREPRWSTLAIIHRLDKGTSGVIVFAKSRVANRSLTAQFTEHTIRKKYLLVTDRQITPKEFTLKSCLVRAGERYLNRPESARGDMAETHFRPLPGGGAFATWEAVPQTGRTHQIRVHAAASGFPILGDVLYGGTSARRLFLHASEITLKHPDSGKEMTFKAAVEKGWLAEGDAIDIRSAIIEPELTNAYRIIHGASDGWPGWYVDRLGDFILSQAGQSLAADKQKELARLMQHLGAKGTYHKVLTRRTEERASLPAASPQLAAGEASPYRFTIRENGLQFELSFSEGYSVGLFLDQRDNRRRLLTGHVAADFSLAEPKVKASQMELLNTFAYTCGFSVCAAKAGMRTTSLDLSKKYLAWGEQNFRLNGLDPAGHDFIYGDAFEWLRRLAKQRRVFDVVLLDPPTFSRSKESGAFRVEKDYGKLAAHALALLKPKGILFASANASDWPAEEFLHAIEETLHEAGRKIINRHYAPQPPDFPVSTSEPAHLKTVWLRIG